MSEFEKEVRDNWLVIRYSLESYYERLVIDGSRYRENAKKDPDFAELWQGLYETKNETAENLSKLIKRLEDKL